MNITECSLGQKVIVLEAGEGVIVGFTRNSSGENIALVKWSGYENDPIHPIHLELYHD